MKYFRPATKEDFKEPEMEYDFHLYMEEEIKNIIKDGDITKAITRFNEKTGVGASKAKKLCEFYHDYLQAKRDFENGKDVFVPY